jgi:beta-N-acetylhexosaminidase
MASSGATAIRKKGKQAGSGLASMGVNLDLAPVADTLTNARSFMGARTFGSGAETVAADACAFAGGLIDGGVAATLKHFPGLGGAGATNTDDAPVSIDRSLSDLRRDWAPYRECAGDADTLVMVSNASYPSLTGNTPAVLSRRTYAELRKLGAVGPIITDSLNARSVSGIPTLAIDAISAGANLLLYTDEAGATAARKSLAAAVADGSLKASVVKARAAAVLALRQTLGG